MSESLLPSEPVKHFVHNHGPEEGKGIACRERIVGGKRVGECISPSPEAPPELKELLNEAIERGLEAAYKTPSSGYLGGNTEDRCRTGITVAVEHISSLFSALTSEIERLQKDARREGRAEGYSMAAKDAIQTGHASQGFIDHQKLCELSATIVDLRAENAELKALLERKDSDA